MKSQSLIKHRAVAFLAALACSTPLLAVEPAIWRIERFSGATGGKPENVSLQWDGSSIAATQDFNTRQTPPTTDGWAPPATQD